MLVINLHHCDSFINNISGWEGEKQAVSSDKVNRLSAGQVLRNVTYLCAIGFKDEFLCLRLALGVGHGVVNFVRRVFIAPAGGQKTEERKKEK